MFGILTILSKYLLGRRTTSPLSQKCSSRRLSPGARRGSLAGAGIFIWATAVAVPAVAQTETVLHSFDIQHNNSDGVNPYTGLLLDKTGALYGTTYGSSENVDFTGAVFELVQSGGVWSESVIAFLDGDASLDNGLVSDSDGNLYGTTFNGGQYSSGLVYELSPNNGSWTQKVLYVFCPHRFCRHSHDGYSPVGELAQDGAGNLYGVTGAGGGKKAYKLGCGTFYELSPSGGTWTETVPYRFKKISGCNPTGILRDPGGAFFGTTQRGGAFGKGTVFELSLSNGTWQATVLYNFKKEGGQDPVPNGGLAEDSLGNLYGTTFRGGKHGQGSVFELSPGGGVWTEAVLYSFKGGRDGTSPRDGVHLDPDGAILGTTVGGGNTSCNKPNGCGTVFKLTQSGGVWNKTTLYGFGGNGDGMDPLGSVIEDQNGTLYGTTSLGGADTQSCAYGCGTVFELTQ